MPKHPPAKPTKPKSRQKTPGPKRKGPGPASKSSQEAASLPPREALFVQEYLVDLNGAGAARRAGYAPRSADVTAARLLGKARVKAAVDEAMDERAARTGITQERVLQELEHLAFSNIADYRLEEDGTVSLAEGAHPDAMRALQAIKRKTKTYTYEDGSEAVTHDVEIKLWDKPGPLKLAGRHVGLFPNEVKVDMSEGTLESIMLMAHDIVNEQTRGQG